MATFNFSTITAMQAMAITAADTLILDQGTGSTTTVLFTSAELTTNMRRRSPWTAGRRPPWPWGGPGADSAVRLVGRSLADIGFTNFDATPA